MRRVVRDRVAWSLARCSGLWLECGLGVFVWSGERRVVVSGVRWLGWGMWSVTLTMTVRALMS